MTVETRFATERDSGPLSKLFAAVVQHIPYYNDLAKQSEISKFKPDDLQLKIANDSLSVIIATISDEIAGFCFSRFDDHTIWLEWFGVLEHYRGNGIANILLQELDKTIAPRSCHKIWCDCRTSNKASVHILTGHGYTRLVTLTNHWYKQDFILWEKYF